MKFLSYKLKLLLILLKILCGGRGETLFVEKGTCSQAICDGSLKDPFQDIGSALDSIEKNKARSFGDELQLVIKDKIADIVQGGGAEFFASVPFLMIKIQTIDSLSRVRIIMGEERFLSLQIHGGSLTFQNIDFEGNSVDKSVPYDFQAMEEGTDSFYPGFIKMSSKSSTLLTFKNCSFVGKFLKASKVDIFSSLIFLKNSDWNSAQVSIVLDGVSVRNCHYPRGLIYTDSPVFSYTKKTRIQISNTNITKYTNKNFRHWSGGISMSAKKMDFSDFMIIINNTYLELTNCKIQDSSRIAVAIINNFLELKNISLSNNDNDLEKSPPEFLYLITENSLKMANISFINLTIHTFDDQDDPSERDFPFIDVFKNKAPSTLLNFEKNQALIALGYRNGAVITDIRFEYLNVFKAEHFISAVINLEYLNSFVAERLIFIKVKLESDCEFGVLSVLFAALQNAVYLTNVQITNFYNFAFASSHFAIQMVANSLEVKDFNINKVFYVMKATRDDLANFINSMFYPPIEIVFLKSKVFKGGQLFGVWMGNSFISGNVILNNTDCYTGCLLETGFSNEITIKNVIVDFIYALRNGAITMASSNKFKAANFTVTNTRSDIGVMYMLRYNEITIENSNFLENWGIGKFWFGRDSITGGISMDAENQIVLRNCNFYKGVADTRAGALMAQSNNDISFFGINFIENEAITSDSVGGCIHVNFRNTLNFNGSKFLRNSGTTGGVIYMWDFNHVILQNCILENNKGQYGSIFFLYFNNEVKMININLTENQGFVKGGLFISSQNQQIFEMENIRFIGNKAPFKGNIWEISDDCIIKMKNVFIEYGEKGNGNFLFLNNRNVFIGISIQIINVYDSEVFFFCNNQNSVELSNLLVEDNKWTNSFIFANISNKFKFQATDLRSINISESGNGFMNINEQNTVELFNLKLTNFQSRSRMILTAASRNKVYCDKLQVFDIKTYEGGTSFKVETLNNIWVTDSIFQNIFGYSCEIYLFEAKNNNTFIFRNLSMFGYFSVEQVIKATPSVIKLTDQSNNISFLTSMISMNNSNSLGNEIFTFLNVEGFDNRIFISKTLINISNFLSFLTLDHWGVLNIENSKFKNCIINGELISLRNSQIFFLNVSFNNIKLKSKNALIGISRKAHAQFKRVTCNNDVTFLISSDSSYSVVSSIFLNKFPASSPKYLIINSNGSKASMQAVEIIMKKNKNDSVIISIQSNLVFKRCIFMFNKGHFGALIKLVDHCNLTLLDNKFLGNEADYGGTLYFDNSNGLTITGNTFLLNKAVRNKSVASEVGGKGGCFYSSYYEKDVLLNLDLKNNIFRYNGAKAGGIFFVEGALLSQSLSSENISDFNYFQKNKGEDYGNMYASTVKDVHMVQGSDLNQAGKAKINIGTKLKISSQLSNCLVQILTVDHFNQVTLEENFSQAKQLVYNSAHVLSFGVKNSFLCFDGVSIYSQNAINFIKEGSKNFSVNAYDLLPQLNITNNKTFELNFNVETCQMGDYFDFQSMKCLPCQANFFSFKKNFLEPSSCKSCADEPFFCYGGFNHTPKPRYWRNSIYSTNFMECPIPEACIGDPEFSNIDDQLSIFYQEYDYSLPNGVCGYGYRGVLCNTCQIGFAKTSGLKCSECSGGLSIFLMALKIIVRIMMYYYTAFKALRMMQRVREGDMLPILVYSNCFLKIFMIYCQFIKTIMNFRFNYPSYLKEAFSYFSFSISSGADRVMNLECLFDSPNFPLIYIYCLINVFVPLFVVFTLLLLPKPGKRMTQKVDIDSHKKSKYCLCLDDIKILPFFFMIMLIMAYEETFGLFLSGFSVVNIETDEWPDYRLVKDFEIDFYSARHQIWAWVIALPSSILIGIFIPIFIMIRIYYAKKRNELTHEDFLLKYGYFFYAYDNKHSFYEMCFFLRKVFLVIVELFFFKQFGLSKSNEAQTFSVITCFFYTGMAFYIYLHQPFKSDIYPVLNKMEKMLAHVQAITAWIVCILMTTTDIQASLSLQIFIIICFIVMGLVNIAAIIVWVYYYWKICLHNKLVSALGNLTKRKSKNSLVPNQRSYGLKISRNEQRDEKELNSEECDMIKQNSYTENKGVFELPFQHSKLSPLVIPNSSTLTQSKHSMKRNPFYIINKKPNETTDDFKSFNILLSKTHQSHKANQFLKIFSEFNCKVKNASKLLSKGNGTPSLEISMVVEVDSDLGNLSLLLNKSNFFLKWKQFEYAKPKRELFVLLEVFFSHQTQLSNLLEFSVFDSEKKITQLKLQVGIFITDFFQKETSYILNDEILTDLTSQGIPYPSRALLYQLVCKPLKFLIQIVQTNESTYLRELSLKKHSSRYFDSNLKKCVFL